MDARAFLREVTGEKGYRDQIVHVREIPARRAEYGDPPEGLIPERLWALLRRQNIHRLYAHQAEALEAIAAGRDVVIVTGTASGKTLCYNLPVVSGLLADASARALYVFPTKALSRDQLGLLQRWAGADEAVGRALVPAVYDGDTPAHARRGSAGRPRSC